MRYNNQGGVLGAGGLSAGGTTIPFAVAPNFATLTGGRTITLVLEPGTANMEIVYLTAYTAAALTGTITRQAEDSTLWPATSHAPGSAWIAAPTANDFGGSPLSILPTISCTGAANFGDNSSRNITSITGSGTAATVTINNCLLSVGQQVTIAGTSSGYDGTWTVASVPARGTGGNFTFATAVTTTIGAVGTVVGTINPFVAQNNDCVVVDLLASTSILGITAPPALPGSTFRVHLKTYPQLGTTVQPVTVTVAPAGTDTIGPWTTWATSPGPFTGLNGADMICDFVCIEAGNWDLPNVGGGVRLMGAVAGANKGNLFIGSGAGQNMTPWSAGTPSTENHGFGLNCLGLLTTGSFNTAIGQTSGYGITSGTHNTALGVDAMNGQSIPGAAVLCTGNQNVAIGEAAARGLTSGSDNIMVGYYAGTTTGGNKFQTSSRVIAIGRECGPNTTNSAITDCVLIGYRSIVGGNYAIAIGSGVSATQNGSVAIGVDNGGNAATSTVVNQFTLGTILHTVKVMGAFVTNVQAVTVTTNAGTVVNTSSSASFTNSSAATMAITMPATGQAGQEITVEVLDFSAVAQTIGWTNTENSSVSAPVTSNGSTTLPRIVKFRWNPGTSKWRCILNV